MCKVQDAAMFHFSKNVFDVTFSQSGNLKSNFGIKDALKYLSSCKCVL